MILFTPNGTLNVAHDPSDLPESSDGNNLISGAMVRCKNLRIDQKGIAKTRDGSEKLNESAINTEIWWLEEQGGTRYAFAGTAIYEDETSIETGLTSAQWSAIQYNAFNEISQNIFGLNGTDRKRIEGGAVWEWGIAAPTTAPTISSGHGSGLTGAYNAKYTYLRKTGDTVITESNPSPAGTIAVLADGSLDVEITQPTDLQVTHIRLYRTLTGGEEYFLDQDIAVNTDYDFGYCFDWEAEQSAIDDAVTADANYTHGHAFSWEDTEDYIDGDAYKFTNEDTTHSSENVYTWEERYTESVAWAVSISQSEIEKFGTTSSLVTGGVTVTVTDPNGTPTYAWTKVSGGNIVAGSASSAATSFTASGLASPFESRTATFKCTVTDAPNSGEVTVIVTITRDLN